MVYKSVNTLHLRLLRLRSDTEFLDYEHYLSQQILPPVERLCDPIEGTDRARLAQCLGLDPGRYKINIGGDSEERQFGTLESQMPDSIRFKDCDPLIVCCRKCDGQMPFTRINERDVSFLTIPFYVF